MTNERYFEGLPLSDAPFSVYPRPQMVRESYICLNGCWQFDHGASEPAAYRYEITVPFPPQSRLSGPGVRVPQKDLLFYRRTFESPRGQAGQRVLLHFGAVDNEAQVFLN